MKFLENFLHLILLFVLLCVAALGYSLYYMQKPSGLQQETSVIIRKGMGSRAVVEELASKGVITHPYFFYATQIATGNVRKFKAGEYAFSPFVSPSTVADKLVNGAVVIHKVTVPEGWGVREVKAALLADQVLEGEITRPMPEGSLLPETYHYTYGDTRDVIISRMQEAMEQTLNDAWEGRDEGLPFATKEEALIMASIVEKETGVEGERARVAAVFINRLRIGMRLQTDPSVIYGIEQINDAPMTRPLNLSDLEMPNNYNTYVIGGLPPGPIANPGADAINAVMHPLQTDELYFVATGYGGHNFARTLDEHNKNVAAYREALRNAAQ